MYTSKFNKYNSLFQAGKTAGSSERSYKSRDQASRRIVHEQAIRCAQLLLGGGPQQAATTQANLQTYKESVPMNKLVRTIQDALVVVREIGVLLLWVDSFCIIQDVPQDKATEIGKMGEVYANAFLTLCASRAGAANDGFLAPKVDPFTLDPSVLNSDWEDRANPHQSARFSSDSGNINASIPIAVPDGSYGTLGIRRTIEYDLTLEPLSTRAWTLQERLLATRVVDFGRCVAVACPHLRKVLPATGDGWPLAHKEQMHFADNDLTVYCSEHGDLMDRWHSVVSEYSSRRLSDERDKLSAIAGIAQRICPGADSQTYMAGLWKDRLAEYLLWRLVGYRQKPEAWRTPTWSWASFNGHVEFRIGRRAAQSDILISDPYYDATFASGAGLFGELKDGSLFLTGRIGTTYRAVVAKPPRPSPHPSSADANALDDVFLTSEVAPGKPIPSMTSVKVFMDSSEEMQLRTSAEQAGHFRGRTFVKQEQVV